jgi:hypothetical protein
MILILIIVIALVAWSLHLMQQAVDKSEFSLMLAGTLVAMAAAAMMAVYFLMGDYMLYVREMANRGVLDSYYTSTSAVSVNPWIEPGTIDYYSEPGDRAPLLP